MIGPGTVADEESMRFFDGPDPLPPDPRWELWNVLGTMVFHTARGARLLRRLASES